MFLIGFECFGLDSKFKRFENVERFVVVFVRGLSNDDNDDDRQKKKLMIIASFYSLVVVVVDSTLLLLLLIFYNHFHSFVCLFVFFQYQIYLPTTSDTH